MFSRTPFIPDSVCQHKYEPNLSWFDIPCCVYCDEVHPDYKDLEKTDED